MEVYILDNQVLEAEHMALRLSCDSPKYLKRYDLSTKAASVIPTNRMHAQSKTIKRYTPLESPRIGRVKLQFDSYQLDHNYQSHKQDAQTVNHHPRGFQKRSSIRTFDKARHRKNHSQLFQKFDDRNCRKFYDYSINTVTWRQPSCVFSVAPKRNIFQSQEIQTRENMMRTYHVSGDNYLNEAKEGIFGRRTQSNQARATIWTRPTDCRREQSRTVEELKPASSSGVRRKKTVDINSRQPLNNVELNKVALRILQKYDFDRNNNFHQLLLREWVPKPTYFSQFKSSKQIDASDLDYYNYYMGVSPTNLCKYAPQDEPNQVVELENRSKIAKQQLANKETPNIAKLQNSLNHQKLNDGKELDEATQHGQRDKVMSVPFNVVRIAMSDPIYQQVQIMNKGNFEKEKGNVVWSLTQNGCYTARLANGEYVLISQQSGYYEGQLDADSIPNGKGMMIDAKGVYSGMLQNGRAHGDGFYSSVNGDQQIEGQWNNGVFEKGSIKNKSMYFSGTLLNGLPQGLCNLRDIVEKTYYEGNFTNGQLETTNGRFECESYVYSGGLTEGRKNGRGSLVFAGSKGDSLDGQWEKDEFKQKVSV